MVSRFYNMKLNTSISNRFTRNNYPIQIENTNWNFLIGHLEYSDNVLYNVTHGIPNQII